MNLITKLFLLPALCLILSCSSDDDSDNPYSGIPSGDIVEVVLRDEILTGTTSSGSKTTAIGQKWWEDISGEIRYWGECDKTTENTSILNTYFAFNSGGSLFKKSGVDGESTPIGSWQWKNNNTKDTININYDYLRGFRLSLRALNESQFVYSHEIIEGTCTKIIWGQFGNPTTE